MLNEILDNNFLQFTENNWGPIFNQIYGPIFYKDLF